ncbi:MAG: hypothetical protein K9K37_12785 [Desulfocapsa sp.]|nr:hypothetical protein [Desulfocapsa sp.]
MRKSRKVCNHRRLARLVVMTGVSLFISAGVAFAGVPKDELPVPWEQLVFTGNVFDISSWSATRTLSSVEIVGDSLCMENDIGSSWYSPDGHVNANAHIIFQCGGAWISSPWDYMGVGQQCKHYDAIGDLCGSGWKPRAGTEYYFFLTGISRDYSGGSSEQRTNVVKYEWFGPAGYPPPSCEGPPEIISFTATPSTVPFGKNGLLGAKQDHNVELSWNISNGDRVRLDAATGEYAEQPEGYPVLDGVQLLLEKTNTFTLTAENECTAVGDRPSKSVTVEVEGPPMAGVSLLLRTDYGNAPTT